MHAGLTDESVVSEVASLDVLSRQHETQPTVALSRGNQASKYNLNSRKGWLLNDAEARFTQHQLRHCLKFLKKLIKHLKFNVRAHHGIDDAR